MRYIIHKNELFYIWWYLRLPNTWISSHILASRVAYMNESLNTYGWGTSYVRINRFTHVDTTYCKYVNSVTHTNESCCAHEWILEHLRVTYIIHRNESLNTCWYLTHVDTSYCPNTWIPSHIQTSHVANMNKFWNPHGWGTSYIGINRWTHVDTCHCPDAWIPSHVETSHVAYMDESLNTYGWGTSYIGITRSTHVDTCYRPNTWIMSCTWISHGTHDLNELWHTYIWAISHTRTNHITRTNKSRQTYEWVISDIQVSLVKYKHETRGGGLGSSTIFKKFNEPYAPS